MVRPTSKYRLTRSASRNSEAGIERKAGNMQKELHKRKCTSRQVLTPKAWSQTGERVARKLEAYGRLQRGRISDAP